MAVFDELRNAQGDETPIQNKYCFWYKIKQSKDVKNSKEDYESSIKQIASFQTVEQFWHIYNHMVRPDDVPPGTDFHLFKDGIKPAWEDGNNARGGQWVLRLQKGLSVRYSEDIIYVWNRNADNKEATDKIRDLLRRILALPQFIGLEYRKHQDSLSGINTGGNIQYGANSGSRTPWQRNSSQQQRQSGGSRSGFDRDRDRDRDREDSAADGGLSNVFGKDSSADRDRGHDRDWYSNRPNWDRRSSSNRESDYEKEKDMQRWGAIRRGTGASRDANRDAGFARSGDTERDWSKLRSGSMGSDGSGKVVKSQDEPSRDTHDSSGAGGVSGSWRSSSNASDNAK